MVSEVEMDRVELIPPLPRFTCSPPSAQAAVLTGGGLKTLIPTGRNKAASLNIQRGNPVSGALQNLNAGGSDVSRYLTTCLSLSKHS